MGIHKGGCYATDQLEAYKKARRHLLELFIQIDKLHLDGLKKEKILSDLVDTHHAMMLALAWG